MSALCNLIYDFTFVKSFLLFELQQAFFTQCMRRKAVFYLFPGRGPRHVRLRAPPTQSLFPFSSSPIPFISPSSLNSLLPTSFSLSVVADSAFSWGLPLREGKKTTCVSLSCLSTVCAREKKIKTGLLCLSLCRCESAFAVPPGVRRGPFCASAILPTTFLCVWSQSVGFLSMSFN